MPKFTLRNPVEATQWWKHGDHPEVSTAGKHSIFGIPEESCSRCGKAHAEHGSLYGTYVCPSDWIISTETETGIMTDKVFRKRYIPLVAPRNQETNDGH